LMQFFELLLLLLLPERDTWLEEERCDLLHPFCGF